MSFLLFEAASGYGLFEVGGACFTEACALVGKRQLDESSPPGCRGRGAALAQLWCCSVAAAAAVALMWRRHPTARVCGYACVDAGHRR